MSRLLHTSLLVMGSMVLVTGTARADIYRWDTGEVIPGTEGITPEPGIDLSGWDSDARNLKYAQLSGTDLRDSRFVSTLLDNAHFLGTNLTNAHFSGANLDNTDFSGAVIRGAVFATESAANLTKEQLFSTASYIEKDLRGVWFGIDNLAGADFRGQDLSNASFSWDFRFFKVSSLENARFDDAIINHAILARATTRGFTGEQLYSTASFKQRNLRGVYLNFDDLSGWNFRGQDLSYASLGPELTDADFAEAMVRATFLGNVSMAQLYSTSSYRRLDLQGVGLNSNELAGVDLSSQDLTDTYFNEVVLIGSNLSGADLRGARNTRVDNSFQDAITTNAILPDGVIEGLELTTVGATLIIRDDYRLTDDPDCPNWCNWREPIAIKVKHSSRTLGGTRLKFILAVDPWDSLISFEPGIPVGLGGTLELTFADDVDVATQVGRTIRIFDWTGVEPSGEFKIASPYVWDTSNLYTTGEVTILLIPIGDMDQDSDLDYDDIAAFVFGVSDPVGYEDVYGLPAQLKGDIDQDGDLDYDDIPAFVGLLREASVVPVPEPSSLVAMTLGIALIVISRWGLWILLPSNGTHARGRCFQWRAASSLFVALAVSQSALSAPFSLSEATVADINRAFDRGVLTSESLVHLYLNRIAAYDDAGPALNTMITLNPAALETARALDEERKVSGPRSVLHGVPIVLKDLHDVFGLPTTSGALALRDSYPPDDAFIVRKLRDAGAVILGKTNLDEFGCCSVTLSSLGGQTRNAYDPTRVPGGSSGGTAAAIAANFAVIGTGSDWWDSIQVPATLNAVVGLMPTRALISGDGAMPPPSERRGVTGPIARTVADAAAMLDIIAGVDPSDPVTASSAGRIPDSYLDSLDVNGLHGARIGLVVNYLPLSGPVRTLVDAAVVDMQSQGAEILSVMMPEISFEDSFYNDFEYNVNRYLDSLGPEGRFDNLRELLASGEVLSHDTRGFNGDIRPEDDPKYAPIVAARDVFEASVLGLMDDNQLDAFIYPPLLSPPPPIATAARVWESSSVLRNTNPSPFLGFPSITLPMGFAQFEPTTTPMGIQFLGRPFSEQTLIKLAYAYEQSTQHRLPPGSTPPLLGEPSAPMRVLVRDVYTIVDDDSDGMIDGMGDSAQDVADLTRRPVGEIDDAAANRLIRLLAKFQLPGLIDPQRALRTATLRLFLEDIVGDPPGAVALFHSTGDNDLDLLASDYEDSGYEGTLLDLVGATDEPGKYYEVDVTDLVLADYAADGAFARSAFRLQINEAEFMEDDQGARYVFTMPGAEGNHPELVLTFVPEPGTLVLAAVSCLALACVGRTRPRH